MLAYVTYVSDLVNFERASNAGVLRYILPSWLRRSAIGGRLAFQPYLEPEKTLRAYIDAERPIPERLLDREVGRVLGILLDDYVHGGCNPYPQLEYISLLLSAKVRDTSSATRAADAARRLVRFEIFEEITFFLCNAYRFWCDQVSTWAPACPTLRVRASRLFDPCRYPGDRFASVRELAATVKDLFGASFAEFVIHGSVSDLQLTEYSDLDTWAVIRREALEDPRHLEQIRLRLPTLLGLLESFDPLQHHGIFIAAEQDLNCFCPSRFPPVLLETATSLFDAPWLPMQIADFEVDKVIQLFQMSRRILGIEELPPTPSGLKLYTSWLMLLPVVRQQLTLGFAYKPDGLVRAKPLYSEEAWLAVEMASELRRLWDPSRPHQQLASLDGNLLKHGRQLAEESIAVLDQLPVKDEDWDALVRDGPPAQPSRAQGDPVFYRQREFEDVQSRSALRFIGIPGVRSVYSFGGRVAELGISDIDLAVVIEDALDDASRKEIWDAVIGEPRGSAGPFSRYIRYDLAEVVELKGLVNFAASYPTPLRYLCGADDLREAETTVSPELKRDLQIYRFFQGGFFQLFRLWVAAQAPVLDLRDSLLRLHSMGYSVSMAHALFDIAPANRDLRSQVRRIRSAWFALAEGERTKEVRRLVKEGYIVLRNLLAAACRRVAQGHGGWECIEHSSVAAWGVPVRFSLEPGSSLVDFSLETVELPTDAGWPLAIVAGAKFSSTNERTRGETLPSSLRALHQAAHILRAHALSLVSEASSPESEHFPEINERDVIYVPHPIYARLRNEEVEIGTGGRAVTLNKEAWHFASFLSKREVFVAVEAVAWGDYEWKEVAEALSGLVAIDFCRRRPAVER